MATPAKNKDLHGSAPERCPVALLMVDVINDLEFEGGDKLLRHALAMAQRLAALARRARAAGVPVIYANDNFGKWRSDFRMTLEHCLNDGVRGAPIAKLLAPEQSDYFVLKPKHSAFFATPLELLLDHLGTERLIIAGVAADQCIVNTAADARMRDFEVVVPADGVAALSAARTRRAIDQLRDGLLVKVPAARAMRL